MLTAEIIKEPTTNPENTMIGKKVTVLRVVPNKKVWIKTENGRELVWRMSYLKIITKGEENEKGIGSIGCSAVS